MGVNHFLPAHRRFCPRRGGLCLIYAPASDISREEKDLLAKYVSGGGKLMVLAGPVEGTEHWKISIVYWRTTV